MKTLQPHTREIVAAWKTLEEYGFPPEAVGWPAESAEGRLPQAIENAIDCVVRQREDLLAEVLVLRKMQEACALLCEEMAKLTMLNRSTRSEQRKGQIRRRAFLDAAATIRHMGEEDVKARISSRRTDMAADSPQS